MTCPLSRRSRLGSSGTSMSSLPPTKTKTISIPAGKEKLNPAHEPVHRSSDDIKSSFMYLFQSLNVRTQHVFVRNGPRQRIKVLHQSVFLSLVRFTRNTDQNGIATDFPIRIPPDALVYCSNSCGSEPKGRISSEYESFICRGGSSSIRSCACRPCANPVPELSLGTEVSSASAHRIGFLNSTTLQKKKRIMNQGLVVRPGLAPETQTHVWYLGSEWSPKRCHHKCGCKAKTFPDALTTRRSLSMDAISSFSSARVREIPGAALTKSANALRRGHSSALLMAPVSTSGTLFKLRRGPEHHYVYYLSTAK